MPGRRVAFYSHDTSGLGGIRRNLLIAQKVAVASRHATTLMIAGTREAALFPLPSRVDCITLPAIQEDGHGHHRPRRLHLSLPEVVSLRAHIIQGALEAFRPDLLIVHSEFRGAFRELEPALSWLRMQGGTRCVLGLSDIRDAGADGRREWRSGSIDAVVRDYYDEVWIYGDSRVFDVVREYDLTPEVARKVRYVGYLDQRERLAFVEQGDDGPRALASFPSGSMVLCSVGGDGHGLSLAQAFVTTDLPPGTFGVLLAGPQMANETMEQLRTIAIDKGRVRVMRFVPEPAPLFDRADRLITTGDYYSILEAVSFSKPALIVPCVRPRQEEVIRADRFQALGLIDVLYPRDLSPQRLGKWLAAERLCPRPHEVIDLHGLPRVVQFLAESRAGADTQETLR